MYRITHNGAYFATGQNVISSNIVLTVTLNHPDQRPNSKQDDVNAKASPLLYASKTSFSLFFLSHSKPFVFCPHVHQVVGSLSGWASTKFPNECFPLA